MSHDKIDDAMAINYESDLAHWKKRAIDAESALAAQQSQQEPTEPVAWIEHHKGGDNLNWERVDHCYAKATPLYTAPLSGVRAGMLRALCEGVSILLENIQEKNTVGSGHPRYRAFAAAEKLKAITRAADQVNADSPADAVVVPMEPTDAMLDAMKNEHWRVRGNQWCKEDYMEVYRAMLRAAQEGK